MHWSALPRCVAGVFPGTSRSGATIFVAMLAGTDNRAAATEFAFLVGIPTMYAASAFELLKTLQGRRSRPSKTGHALGIAFVVSTIVAFVAVKWLLAYIRSNRFTMFASTASFSALCCSASRGWRIFIGAVGPDVP